MGRLSDEDFAALEKLQTAVRSNDGGADQSRLQIITRMANRGSAVRRHRSDAAARRGTGQRCGAGREVPPRAAGRAVGVREQGTKADGGGSLRHRQRPEGHGHQERLAQGQRSRRIPDRVVRFPEVDDALRRPGAQLAQAGSEDDKPPRPDSEPSRPEQELRTDAGRMRQLNEEETAARSAVRGNMNPVEIDRWISDWLSSYRPEDAAPPQMPAGLADRLTPGQKTEIEDIVSGGADTKTDRQVLEEIRRGLRSGDDGRTPQVGEQATLSLPPVAVAAMTISN